MPAIEVGKQRIEYLVTKGNSRRYTYFKFKPDMTLEVVVPRGRTVDVDSAIRARQKWILRQYQALFQSRKVLEADRLMFDGSYLDMVFEPNQTEEEIVLDAARARVTIRASVKTRVNELIRRWFLKETSRYVVMKLSELARELPMKYHRADVREIKSWGYCTRDGRLSFSWQLIALPEKLREYVIFHELAHLSEFSHSRAFKARLASLCPRYRELENELDRISPMVVQWRVSSGGHQSRLLSNTPSTLRASTA